MALISVAGFASAAALAVFALFNVTTRDSNNPNIPVAVQLDSASQASQKATDKLVIAPVEKVETVKVAASSKDEKAAEPQADEADEDAPAIIYTNPPSRTPAEQKLVDQAVAALKAEVKGIDYERARFHRLHFKPAITKASNEECLVCHEEIMTRKPRKVSIAGAKADNVLAWYQTLDTYKGNQQSFHYRHLESDYAKKVMNLSCVFCHKGNDIREESPDMTSGQKHFTAPATPDFTLRKMVNPSTTCLRCHGKFPYENMDGVEDNWNIARKDIEDEDVKNGCLTCHGEGGFRPDRHNVTYLNAANIEELAKESSDVCFGCHGGRQWYRVSYPYPRHPWPDMDTEETPDWAKGRSTSSEPQYQRKTQAAK